MHRKLSAVGYDDGLAEPGSHKRTPDNNDPACTEWGWREQCQSSAYGPYLVPQWFTDDSIMYTLSTWVPYQVHLMRTKLAENRLLPISLPSPQPVNLPPAKLTNSNFGGLGSCTLAAWQSADIVDWQSAGDTFTVFKGRDGFCRMTTFTTKGNDALGALFQDFTVDAGTKALRFYIHGGEATVRLYRGGEIVRATRGRSGRNPNQVRQQSLTTLPQSDKEVWETEVCWNLGDYVGQTLRVAIFDNKIGDWGFVGARGFEFVSSECPRPR